MNQYTKWYEIKHPLWKEFLSWSEFMHWERHKKPMIRPRETDWRVWKHAYEATKRVNTKRMLDEIYK